MRDDTIWPSDLQQILNDHVEKRVKWELELIAARQESERLQRQLEEQKNALTQSTNLPQSYPQTADTYFVEHRGGVPIIGSDFGDAVRQNRRIKYTD